MSIIDSKGKIRIDNSDGTFTELTFTLSQSTCENILKNILFYIGGCKVSKRKKSYAYNRF